MDPLRVDRLRTRLSKTLSAFDAGQLCRAPVSSTLSPNRVLAEVPPTFYAISS